MTIDFVHCEMGGRNMGKIIDAHAHACGEYLTAEKILKIIIGHLYWLELFIEDSKEAFRNVSFDLSNGYFVSKERIMLGYSHFGAEHFLLGSDTPYGKKSLELTLSMIKKLDITEEDLDKICGLNILKLLDRSEL